MASDRGRPLDPRPARPPQRSRLASRAWVDFLWAAQARANLTRRQRPALARQEARWMLGAAADWLVLARLLPRSQIAAVRGRGLVWWAGCAVMLDWHLGMLETPEGRAVELGAADALTLLRAWLVPAIASRAEPTLLLLGALSGLADGRVARATRRTRARTRPRAPGRRVLFLGRAARRGSRRRPLPGQRQWSECVCWPAPATHRPCISLRAEHPTPRCGAAGGPRPPFAWPGGSPGASGGVPSATVCCPPAR